MNFMKIKQNILNAYMNNNIQQKNIINNQIKNSWNQTKKTN